MLSTLAAYPLIGASSSLVTRLLQRYFPTPLEKAQHEHVLQSMKLAREEVAAREARAEKDWQARRELLLTQIEATGRQEQDRDLMRRWPLKVTAAAIVRASQKLDGRALNVIVAPNWRRLNQGDLTRLNLCWHAFNVAVDRMQDSADRYFGNDLLFYWENAEKLGAKSDLRGQELVATVHALTETEPTVLIQFALVDENGFQLSWSTWGWAGDEGLPDSGTVRVEIGPDEPELDRVMEQAMVALICALSDRFQMLRGLPTVKEPRFVNVKPFVEGLEMTVDGGGMDGSHSVKAGEALVQSYIAALDKVSQSAPHLAADLAATVALRSQAREDGSTAVQLLDRALQYYRAGLPETVPEDDVVASLMQKFFEGPSPQNIQLALRDVRDLSYSDFANAHEISEVDEIIFRLGYFDNPLTKQEKEKVRAKLVAIITYKPTAAIMGKCGAGKSSLANALFGQDTFKVGHTRGTTRKAQQRDMTLGRSHGITILDMPGVGEDQKHDIEYRDLYEEWLPKIDVLLWAIKADDRALSVDQAFYRDIVKPHLHDGLPLLIVVTQADAIHPMRQWNLESRKPGPDQVANLREKRQVLADMFKVKDEVVLAVSAVEKFNLQELTHRMILSLPNEKRVSMARSVRSENKSELTYQSVTSSVDEEVTKTIGEAWRSGYRRSGIGGGLVSVGKHFWRKIFG